jgi:HEAT repeat protein
MIWSRTRPRLAKELTQTEGHEKQLSATDLDIAGLIESLGKSEIGLRTRAARALGDLGPAAKAALPNLIDALQDPGSTLRYWAVRALGEIGSEAEAAVPYLIDALNDPDSDAVRSAAANALTRIDPRGAVSVLIEALKDPDTSVRASAAYALGDIGPDALAAVPALTVLINDANSEVRVSATEALRAIRSRAESS